jgi:hypothetical protein
MTDKTDDNLLMWIGGLTVIAVPVILFVTVLWSGLVFQMMWNWFAPPFTTIQLSLPQAIGTSCLAGCIRGYRPQRGEPRKGEWALPFTVPAVILIVGYFAHQAL